MSKKSFFSQHAYQEPTVQKLPAGNQEVTISSKQETSSFYMLDGTLKEGISDKIDAEEIWTDESPQFAVTFVSTKGKGVMTYRFNGLGYKHVEDFTEEELEDDKYEVVGDYVCIRNKKGNLVRLKDDDRTNSANRFMNQFLRALKAEEGENIVAKTDEAIASKQKLVIRVIEKEYDGKPVFDIDKFSPATSDVAEKEGIDADEF